VRLVITSDTHVPARARDLPPRLWRDIVAADVVIHAGDWVHEALLDVLSSQAARLIGVYGNNDGPALRARLPEIARASLGGLRFAVVHETGAAKGREARCAARFPDTDVLVFGHSHIPWDTTVPRPVRPGLRSAGSAATGATREGGTSQASGPVPAEAGASGSAAGGLRLLNPGSPTDRRRQPICTHLTATVEGGRLHDVTLVNSRADG
jgi:putative phosphoesterase